MLNAVIRGAPSNPQRSGLTNRQAASRYQEDHNYRRPNDTLPIVHSPFAVYLFAIAKLMYSKKNSLVALYIHTQFFLLVALKTND